ncbi:PREDICTED: uncharacterized protein LOC108615224 [Drosophila arizonae]|uniref:Uncharacterized protein LOC108615224 n=1 Tax=Drosophila arizonae TaxID=7263 RepID=A0ABM1PCX3_DROAR|nr:PREDICTED: uncharacterized protein LOC108615224 [Drosophila arizonae]
MNLKLFAVLLALPAALARDSSDNFTYVPIAKYFEKDISKECVDCVHRVEVKERSRFLVRQRRLYETIYSIEWLKKTLKAKNVTVHGDDSLDPSHLTICYTFNRPSANVNNPDLDKLKSCRANVAALKEQNVNLLNILEMNNKTVAAYTADLGQCQGKRLDLVEEYSLYKGLLLVNSSKILQETVHLANSVQEKILEYKHYHADAKYGRGILSSENEDNVTNASGENITKFAIPEN